VRKESLQGNPFVPRTVLLYLCNGSHYLRLPPRVL
jgi:hypothetical protein